MTQLKPEVSVITVVKNDSAGLEKTLHSLLAQSFTNWECLIISAFSEDETKEVANQLAKRDSRINHYNEKSPGIYQSMNHGIELAEGAYAVFMNAGDVFANPNAIGILHNEILEGNYSVVVGGYSTGDKEYSFNPRKFGPNRFSLNRRWGCHQSMIFKLVEIKYVKGFSEQYKLASDFEVVLKLVCKKPGKRISEVVARVDPNGISNTQIGIVLKEKQKIRREFFGRFTLNLLLGKIWTYLVSGKICLRLFFAKLT